MRDTAGFHFHEVLEKTNLIYSDQNQVMGGLGLQVRGRPQRSTRGIPGWGKDSTPWSRWCLQMGVHMCQNSNYTLKTCVFYEMRLKLIFFMQKIKEKPSQSTALTSNLTLPLPGWWPGAKQLNTTELRFQVAVRVGDNTCQTPGIRVGLQ